MPFRLLFTLAVCLSVLSSCAQDAPQPPFYQDIEKFRKADKEFLPPPDAILFVGSSSFTMWQDVHDYFPEQTIINRGFGGSQLSDLIRYADDVILPYHARQVVIYCGENDIAAGVPVTEVFERFQKLFSIIRGESPDAPHVLYVSMKPSPSREQLLPQYLEANALIREYLDGYPNTGYVDIFTPMLDGEGHPRQELFLNDNLHMNKKGYEIWKEAIAPHLLQ